LLKSNRAALLNKKGATGAFFIVCLIFFWRGLGVIGLFAYPIMDMHAVIDELVLVMKMHERIALNLFFHGGRGLIGIVVAW
jgi:hypothetical protein